MTLESDAVCCTTFEELKEIVVKIAQEVDSLNNSAADYAEYREQELISERVSNIETCLENSKINTENLRL